MKLVIVLFSTLMGSTYMAELSTAQSVACVCVLGRELGVDRLVTVRSSKAILQYQTLQPGWIVSTPLFTVFDSRRRFEVSHLRN